MKTFKKSLRHTPRKMRLVVDMIRPLSIAQSLDQLSFSTKHAAIDLKKALQEAINNAKAKDPTITADNLQFKQIQVNEGMIFKRIRFGGRGRIKPYQKRTCHLLIELEPKVELKAPLKSPAKPRKNTPKPETKPAKKPTKKTTKTTRSTKSKK